MGVNKKFSIGRVLALIGVVFIFIIALGITLYFQGVSISPWWIPLLFSIILAAASGLAIWKVWIRLTSLQSFLPNFLSNMVFMTFLFTATYYTLNYAVPISTTNKNVEVISKFQETHYRSRRVGRRSYAKGEPYYEYYIRIRLENNQEKKLQLPFDTYKRIKTGNEITLPFTKGCLGATMIHTSTILKDNPQLTAPKAKRKRCRFFGTHK